MADSEQSASGRQSVVPADRLCLGRFFDYGSVVMTVKIVRTLLCLLVAMASASMAPSSHAQSSTAPVLNTPAVVSPDGQRAAYVSATGSDGGICTVEIASPWNPVCVKLAGPPQLDFIVWSPDSGRVAFTSDVMSQGLDGDIYVLAAGGVAITNLTNDDPERDGLEGRSQGRLTRPDRERVLLVDTAPIWSQDGQNLYFLRYDAKADVKPLWLMRISADGGGEPEQVLKVSDDPVYSTGTLTWMDESSLLLTSWWDGTLFEIDLGNRAIVEQSFLKDAGHKNPKMLSISSNGKRTIHTLSFAPGPFSRGPLFFLVDWDDQSIADIQTFVTNSEERVYWPVLLPDGTSRIGNVVYITPSGSATVEVMLLHLESGEAISLGQIDGFIFSDSPNDRLQVVRGDTLAITTESGTWLFTIPARFIEP